MHTIQINDDVYQLPANWDDLSREQLEFLARATQSNQPVEQLKILMLLKCLKARMRLPPRLRGIQPRMTIGTQSERFALRIGRKLYRLTAKEVESMSSLFHWLLKPVRQKYNNQEEYYLNPLLTVNHYPSLRIRLHRFTSPDDCLFDITFEQYMYMQTYLDAAVSDPKKLNYLLACLWHTGKSFDISRLEHDARLIRHLSPAKKMVMYWFVLGCIQTFADSYPRVFSGTGKAVGNVFDNQLRLLDSLASHDMTKKDSVRRGLFIDALYSMDEQLRIQEEREVKMQGR